jgi:Na+/H+ antiporter NhaD/arsenite permease-like protein
VLTAFNDNAAITFLAAQVPALSAATPEARALQFAVLAGAVTGGGLTVIANAPNPAGQSILAKHFEHGISAGRLLVWAIPPTLVAAACFLLLPR